MTTAANEKLHVQIGQVKVGREGQSLTAILGSCIGLGLLYPAEGIFGLAHCLLSKSGTKSEKLSGRHVDQAFWSLQSMMDLNASNIRKVKALIVGGANMTMPADTDPARLVGSINAKFAYGVLRQAGLRNIYEDVGGLQGRQVTIDCTSGEFTVAHIPRLGE
ncbi:chemotaxis protein CheD [Shimia sp. R9_2]|uniref:chemotaxis protein CheD n=1 Tax=Shimia sp. R9_2 TaxID=2821112 RepID=UPI001ADA30AC|nr:chemotaxis protein CheD [Shimia sp. R9_2]MBO9399048.1 chemotaxis protein CheD [Shimia sp. R9_2]